MPIWRWRRSKPSYVAGNPRRSAARPRSTPTTKRCSTCSATGPSIRLFGSVWRATTCSTWHGRSSSVTRWPRRAVPIGSKSRCWRAWPPRRPVPCATRPAACCCTHRWCRVDDFPAAVAYLVRRLDENTSPDNFLSHLFDLGIDVGLFDIEADRFRSAARGSVARSTATHGVTRTGRCPRRPPIRPSRSRTRLTPTGPARPTVAGSTLNSRRARASDAGVSDRVDVTVESVDACVAGAVAAQASWRSATAESRADILHGVGDVFEAHRGRILATMAGEAAKTAGEGDPEVSEAIDFAALLRERGPASRTSRRCHARAARHRRGDPTVELPVRDPRRRCARRARVPATP